MIPELSERGLILAPGGRDTKVAAGILAEAGIRSSACEGVSELVQSLVQGAGFALVTEEALRTANLRALSQWLEAQPEWSDFPFVLLTVRGGGLERNPAAVRYIETLGNVTFLERPFHPTTLVSLARAAIRARRRQYDARARLEALRESEGRYRQIVEGAEDFAIVTLDDQGIITSWNSGAETITGFGEQDAVGKGEDIFFTPEDRAAGAPDQERQRARAEGRAVNERWHQRKDGTLFWGSGLMMHLDNGGYLKIFRDRTAEHEAEASVRRMNETLEARVAERTADLVKTQDALRQSQKMEAMGTLTGGVAHDFNNLLAPIVGSLDLLHRRGLGNERERRLVEGALQAAERAKTLVQRLLAFARRQPLQATSVDLHKLVEGMAELVGRTSGPRVKVEVDIPLSLPPVRTDANQLEMALLNLAVNARDAMEEGGKLTISADLDMAGPGHRTGLPQGRYIHLSVADTGRGMDEETLRRAVEPFFSTKGVGKGTGLGLSMVHGLVAQLGGAMMISSEVGVGTNVELWLPLANEAAAVVEASAVLAPSTSAGRALLVEDEELVRMSTADMLSELGYAVTDVSSAEEALRLINRGFSPDLIVTDHLMPGMTGTELARRVRDLRPATPVLVVSGYAEVEGITADLPRLTKPFRQIELATSLAAMMNRSSSICAVAGKLNPEP